MKNPFRLDMRATAVVVAIVFVAVVIKSRSGPVQTSQAQTAGSTSNAPQSKVTVDLSSSQLPAIKLQPVESYVFSIEKKGIGSIDFDNKLYFDNTLSVQVFPPREGKIVKTVAELGDEIQKGEPLYTIATADEPALVYAVPSPVK